MKRTIVASFLCLAFVSMEAAPQDKKTPDAKKPADRLITKDTQKAIDAALAYLVKEQHDDGSFGTGAYNGNVAVTGLAGLAILSSGTKPGDGDAGKALTKAIRNLLSLEDKAIPGFLNKKAGFHGPMYGHGFAALFLAEAYPTIADKKLKAEVKEALERAVKLLVDVQSNEGGWRYQPRKQDADITVTAVQIVALRAARDAGFEVPKATFEKAGVYIKTCQDKDSGGFRYQAFGGKPGFARSAAGVAALDRIGIKDGGEIKKGMTYVEKFDRKAFDPGMAMHYFYGHFYAAKAMHNAGDKKWTDWYGGIRDELLASQTKDKNWASGLMCPHYCTAMALIILQMPYEHLPSLKPAPVLAPKPAPEPKKEAKVLITPETQKAIDAGLMELAKTQKDDGSWEPPHYAVGISSIAAMAFLAGPPQPEHGKVVGKALAYVLSKQDKQGFIGPRTGSAMYGHGYALLFLADVSESLTDKKQKDDVKSAMEKAVKVLVDSQSAGGGWRYLPSWTDQDSSITSVQLQGLCAARRAGVEVPQATIDKAVGYLKKCQYNKNGGFTYVVGNANPTLVCSGAALTALNRAGIKDEAVFKPGVAFVHKIEPKTFTGNFFFYGHHHAGKAVSLAGEKEFEQWFPAIRDELLRRQKDGRWIDHGFVHYPNLDTALAVIILQLPHGKLPSLKR
jgi:prenyltransferase beta subunit